MIKYYAWEKNFETIISDVRAKEVAVLTSQAYWRYVLHPSPSQHGLCARTVCRSRVRRDDWRSAPNAQRLCVVLPGGVARAGLDLNVFRLLAHQLAHPVSRRVRACRVPRGQPIHGVFARMPCGIYEHSEIIFPALAYFNLLRVPMTFLPVLIIGTS